MANDEEKSIHEVIQEAVTLAVAQSMKPVYIGISGIMLTFLVIFVSIAWPINDRVTQNSIDVNKKVDSDEAYKNFLTKNQYMYLQKEEHKADVDAISSPMQSHLIYSELNASTSEQLDIRYRGVN